MDPSPIGLLVAVVLGLFGRALGSAVVIGLFLSTACAATAIGAVPALGGSSPQIFTLYSIVLFLTAAFRPGAARDYYRLFRRHWAASLAVALVVYAIVGAFALPRLFAGKTSVFTPIAGRIYEAPLAPVSGNVSQTLYFVLGILTFLALAATFARTQDWRLARIALLSLAAANAVLGLVDIGAKLVGIVDILEPIRTGTYAFLTSASERSFWRIAGGHPEASGFAQAALASFAIAFCYWRRTADAAAFVIAGLNAILLVFSTSSTAYVALAVLFAIAAMNLTSSLVSGKIHIRDFHTIVVLGAVVLVLLSASVVNTKLLLPFIDMLDTMVLKKGSSDSASERAYWNAQGLEAFLITGGVGIGFGSSRTSSWLIAMISQLGLAGCVAVFALIVSLCRDAGIVEADVARDTSDDRAGIAAAARAGALASLLGLTVSGGSADPGIVFFLCLAVVTALRMSMDAVGVPTRPRKPYCRRRLRFGDTLGASARASEAPRLS